jgi:hypothetical protein
VFLGKCISGQMLSGHMSFWAIVFLCKCLSGQMSFWAIVFLGKCLSGQMDFLGNCLSGQMSFWANVFWANVFLGKCLSGQMSFWANVVWANVSGQMSPGKCCLGKCHGTRLMYLVRLGVYKTFRTRL